MVKIGKIWFGIKDPARKLKKGKKMQTVAIKDFGLNQSVVTKSLENSEFILITKKGTPFGIATTFDETIIQSGLYSSLVLKAFEQGNISLSQLCKSLKLTKLKTMKLLSTLNIPITDYELKEDLKGIERFLR